MYRRIHCVSDLSIHLVELGMNVGRLGTDRFGIFKILIFTLFFASLQCGAIVSVIRGLKQVYCGDDSPFR